MDEVTTEDVFGPEKEPTKQPVKEEPKVETTSEPKEPESEKEPEPEKEPETEPKQEQDTGETAPTPGEKPPKGYVPLAAIEDERRKRQEYERRFKDLERQQREQQQQQAGAPKGFLDDPEGYIQQTAIQIRAETSQQVMKSLHQDYDEMESYLVERVESDPLLAAQVSVGLANSPNPAKFAYDTAKRLKRDEQFESAGGLEKWQEKQREELKKQILEELKAKQPQNPEVEAPPESLAAAPSNVSQTDTFKPPSSEELFN